MPQKKQLKNNHKKSNYSSLLRTWIFDKPAFFAVLSFGIMFIVSLVYALIASVLNLSDSRPLFFLLVISFVWSICYLIKKLPHDEMPRNDFIAITNACCLITTFIPIITLLITGTNIALIKRKLFFMNMHNPGMLWVMFLCVALLYLYVFGLVMSNIYAKYKRAREIGIDNWKIICSFPFSFFLMWTPGYLINDKKNTSKVQIKTHWFSRLNKWIVGNKQNTILAFCILLLLSNMFAGLSTLLWIGFLLAIYILWYVKHKTKFLKNINNGYALSAVSINIACIIILIISSLV